MHPLEWRKPSLRAAFTLIELLGAMTVLLLILSIMATVLGESGRLWRMGTDRNRHLTVGRAALDMIAIDLEQAVANSNLLFSLPETETRTGEPFTTFGYGCNEIGFFRIIANPGNPRHRPIELVLYGAESITNRSGRTLPGRYQLTRKTRAFLADAPEPFWPDANDPSDDYRLFGTTSSAPLLDSLAAIRFSAAMTDGQPFPDPDNLSETYTNALPAYVDIYLELLTPAEARRAAGLSDDPPDYLRSDFVERHVIRLTRRVALNPMVLP